MYSNQYNIKIEKTVPYLDQEDNLFKTFDNGGKSRKISPLKYACIRVRNYLLFLIAYVAPSNYIRVKLNKWKGVNVGKNVYIGMFVFIDNAYPDYVYIEDDVAVNAGCMLITHFNLKKHFEPIVLARVAPVLIKKGAMVAIRSIVLPGVMVGEYAMISAASVVSEDVDSYTLVKGNPAKKAAKYKL